MNFGRTALGVLALAALALALTAGTGRADEEEQQPPRGKGGPARDDLQQLEKDLKHKLEEVEKLKKQLAEASKGGKKGGEIRVTIRGASKEEVATATAALKKAMPEKDVKVSGHADAKHGPWAHHGPGFAHMGFGFGGWHHKGQHRPEARHEHKAPAKVAPKEVRASTDKRLESLEQKLGEIVKELEALRKQSKGGESRGGPGGRGFPPRR